MNDNEDLGPDNAQIYKVALASIVGSIIEQYDFLVTGVIAATIWGDVFFKLPKLAASAAAIGVYGIGIIIRPVGAYCSVILPIDMDARTRWSMRWC